MGAEEVQTETPSNGTQDRILGGVVGIGAAQQNREHKRPKDTGRTRETIMFTM